MVDEMTTIPMSRRRLLAVAILLLVAFSNSPIALASQNIDRDAEFVAPGYTLSVGRSRDKMMQFPRSALQVGDSIFVLDFGGWVKNRGRLLRMKNDFSVTSIVFRGLDRPHGLALGPDGLVYVGESTQIFSFDAKNPQQTRKLAVSLPSKPGTWKHPLTQFAWLPDGSMLVNNGSKSDNCQAGKGANRCPETLGFEPAGSLLTVPVGSRRPNGVFASGLRNSMAILVHRSGTVIAAENSRDAINDADPTLDDAKLPHDELNVITSGSTYGWPYCFDKQRNAPEFPSYDCSKTVAPTVLLPAHSAPLGATYWRRNAAPELLVIALHGYRDTGHRLVAFNVDSSGRPVGASIELVRWKGDGAADDEIPGPVGLSVSSSGSLLISDDRRGKLLTLSSI